MNKSAAFLSLIIPGAGQIGLHHFGKGFLILLAILPAYGIHVIVGLLVHAIAVYDAAKSELKVKAEGQRSFRLTKTEAKPKAEAKKEPIQVSSAGTLGVIAAVIVGIIWVSGGCDGEATPPTAAEVARSATKQLEVDAVVACQARITPQLHHPRSADFDWHADATSVPTLADLDDPTSEKTVLIQITQNFESLNGFGLEIPSTMYCVVEYFKSTNSFHFHRLDTGA
jgi:hypothetical protein